LSGHQAQKFGNYILPYTRIEFPRGFPARISKSLSSLQVNYAFPLLYPDLAFGLILYLKRLKVNLFYDVGYGKDIRVYEPGLAIFSDWLESFGTELSADFHALRFIFPLSAGIRLGYRTSDSKSFAEFLLRLDTTI